MVRVVGAGVWFGWLSPPTGGGRGGGWEVEEKNKNKKKEIKQRAGGKEVWVVTGEGCVWSRVEMEGTWAWDGTLVQRKVQASVISSSMQPTRV